MKHPMECATKIAFSPFSDTARSIKEMMSVQKVGFWRSPYRQSNGSPKRSFPFL